ncbi:hypothetical protein [Aureimonas leprariae]|uniref:Uncharacterized protein n=1 Tax=Plantimonas leprariae TaxID=2615207 RepID=A0A7V7PLH2_9HYPH|nr:hypothetical protein [Aureimonas leprariae]KAB0677212.1 hypothetical protein F6X38_19010 [Aureimonas leprariae]
MLPPLVKRATVVDRADPNRTAVTMQLGRIDAERKPRRIILAGRRLRREAEAARAGKACQTKLMRFFNLLGFGSASSPNQLNSLSVAPA